MERTKLSFKIPDAINCSVTKNFTQVPNDLLKNPNISGKAKTILCILLSNKQGWHSYMQSIKQMMKEGEDAIRTGIAELEENQYLLRIRYRCKATKTWRGSFWAYTDVSGQFNIDDQLRLIQEKEMEVVFPQKPDVAFPDVAFPDVENPSLIIYNNNNTKNNNNISVEKENPSQVNKNITLSHFPEFWQSYPKKVDKGKALSAWKKLCSRPAKERPMFRQIKRAIKLQKESQRWQDPQFIPHPTTWLNQNRWLDDPQEMKTFNKNNNENNSKQEYDPWLIRQENMQKYE